MPVRCAVLPPVAVPYREPLFALVAQSPEVDLRVIYQSEGQPGWDQPAGWFASDHPYDAVALGSRQRARPGRTPVVVPRGVGRALAEFDPGVVVSWEYGPTTLRALAWCRRRGRALVIFSELPPHADSDLPVWQLRLHGLLVGRADRLRGGLPRRAAAGHCTRRRARLGAREPAERRPRAVRRGRVARRRLARGPPVRRASGGGQEPAPAAARRWSGSTRSWLCAAPGRSRTSCAPWQSSSGSRRSSRATWLRPTCLPASRPPTRWCCPACTSPSASRCARPPPPACRWCARATPGPRATSPSPGGTPSWWTR